MARRTRSRRSRRRSYRRFRMNPVRTKTITRYRVRSNPRRRRRGGRRSASIGGLNIRSILSRNNLTIAGGAVAASSLTDYVIRNFGRNLPGITNVYAVSAYQVAIPAVGAYLTRRFSPALAQGMLIGGLANGIGSLIANFLTPAARRPAATAAYPRRTRGMGEYLDPVSAYLAPAQNAGTGGTFSRYSMSDFGAWSN